MSSNAITKIDSKLVGEMEPVSIEDAEKALIGANMPQEANPADNALTRVRDRAVIGRFIASSIGGYVVANAESYLTMLEKAARSLEREFDDPKTSIERKVMAAEALKNVSNSAASQSLVQLKGAELLAYGGEKRKKKSLAPQGIRGISVVADNVQINSGQSPAGNGVAP
jgi:hypothetical protein